MGWKEIELIKSNRFRYVETTSLRVFVEIHVKESGFHFFVAFRLVNDEGGGKQLGAILWKLRNHQQIQIFREIEMGYGLYISQKSMWKIDGMRQTIKENIRDYV